MLSYFFSFAKSKKAEPDSAEHYQQSISTIKTQLKGLIGQNLFTYDVYYEVTNEQNPVYLRALQAFSDGSFVKYGIEQQKPEKSKNKASKLIKNTPGKPEKMIEPEPAQIKTD
jgi:hypothetical protein